MKSHKNLDHKIAQLEKVQGELVARLTKNPVYEIPWVTEELYKSSLRLDYLRAAVKDITGGTETFMVYQHYIKVTTDFLKRKYNVIENSTSIVHREASIWKYQMMFEIKETFEYLFEIETENDNI